MLVFFFFFEYNVRNLLFIIYEKNYSLFGIYQISSFSIYHCANLIFNICWRKTFSSFAKYFHYCYLFGCFNIRGSFEMKRKRRIKIKFFKKFAFFEKFYIMLATFFKRTALGRVFFLKNFKIYF